MSGQESTTTPTRRRSFASSGLSYERVARELSLRLCDGSLEGPREVRHREGHVTLYPLHRRAIHWNRRVMTRRGLFKFLGLASLILFPSDTVNQVRWLGLYNQDRHARKLAMQFGVRIPKEYGRRDKARVRLDLSKIDLSKPAYSEFPEQREIIRRVQRWARS